jgi:UDP-N-acetylmuramoyl-L-alanyl-D-glutamate--2,6-diaminopimelate ligase
VISGAPGARDVDDRGRAIAEAVAMLEAGDALVIAGKGHETGQIIKNVTYPFSDQAEAEKALARRAGQG